MKTQEIIWLENHNSLPCTRPSKADKVTDLSFAFLFLLLVAAEPPYFVAEGLEDDKTSFLPEHMMFG